MYSLISLLILYTKSPFYLSADVMQVSAYAALSGVRSLPHPYPYPLSEDPQCVCSWGKDVDHSSLRYKVIQLTFIKGVVCGDGVMSLMINRGAVLFPAHDVNQISCLPYQF